METFIKENPENFPDPVRPKGGGLPFYPREKMEFKTSASQAGSKKP
jgi:hypothetical protein